MKALFIFLLFAAVILGEGHFKILESGKVEADSLVFSSLKEYISSDYFKENRKRCLLKRRKPYKRELMEKTDCDLNHTEILEKYWNQDILTIPVVFHVIYNSSGQGNISDQRIYDQIQVLNEDYRALSGTLGGNGYDTRIQFELKEITRTQNNDWFNDKNETQFKSQLGWDQEHYLNIYSNSAGGYLGYSYLPPEEAGSTFDGVVVLYESVGGRDNGYDVYDQGRTLTHEVGHYLGLHHPFEGYNCENGYDVGDLINDTYSEEDEHYGCSESSSCGTPDNIHNYMNYTDDICMEEFTPEQANRMVCSILNYRPDLPETSSQPVPSLQLTYPNGGQSFQYPSTVTVTWTSSNVDEVSITLLNGSAQTVIAQNIANTGSYGWSLPKIKSQQCKMKIADSDSDISSQSSSYFSITYDEPQITFIQPNSSSIWDLNSSHTVIWDYQGPTVSGSFYLKEYSKTGRSTDELTLLSSSVNLNSETLTVSIPDGVNGGDNYTIFCQTQWDGASYEFESQLFEILEDRGLSITYPRVNDTLREGIPCNILWQAVGSVNEVNLKYKNGINGQYVNIAANLTNSGSYIWSIPELYSHEVYLKIEDTDDMETTDELGPLTVIPKKEIEIDSPAVSKDYYCSETILIKWINQWDEIPVDIIFNNGVKDSIIAGNLEDEGTYLFKLSSVPIQNCHIKIRNSYYHEDFSQSVSFNIVQREIEAPQIVSPTSGISVYEGESVRFQGNLEELNDDYNFYWDFGNGITYNSIGPIDIIYNQAGMYNVYFWYETDELVSDSAKLIISVNLPDAVIESPAEDTSITFGDSLKLSGKAYTGESTVLEIWNISNGDSLTGSRPASYVFPDTGAYSIVYFYKADTIFSVKDSVKVSVVTDDREFLAFKTVPWKSFDGVRYILFWETNRESNGYIRYGENSANMSYLDILSIDNSFIWTYDESFSSGKLYFQTVNYLGTDTIQSAIDSFSVKEQYAEQPLIIERDEDFENNKLVITVLMNLPIKMNILYGNSSSMNNRIISNRYQFCHQFMIDNYQTGDDFNYRIEGEDMGGISYYYPAADESFSIDFNSYRNASLPETVFYDQGNSIGMFWNLDRLSRTDITLLKSGKEKDLIGSDYYFREGFAVLGDIKDEAYQIRIKSTDLSNRQENITIQGVGKSGAENTEPEITVMPAGIRGNDYIEVSWETDRLCVSAMEWGHRIDSMIFKKKYNRMTKKHKYFIPLIENCYFRVKNCANEQYLCGEWSDVIYLQTNPVQEKDADNYNDFEEGFQVYPNPVTDKINVKIKTEKSSKIEMKIYNLLGRIMFTEEKELSVGETVFSYDLKEKGFSSGAYFVMIQMSGKYYFQKIMIVH